MHFSSSLRFSRTNKSVSNRVLVDNSSRDHRHYFTSSTLRIVNIWAPLLHINMQRFRGGLVYKAHRLLYHSTLGLRVIKKSTSPPPRRWRGAELALMPCFRGSGYCVKSLRSSYTGLCPHPTRGCIPRWFEGYGLGFRGWGLGVGIWSLWLRVSGVCCMVYGVCYMVYGVWCMAHGVGF